MKTNFKQLKTKEMNKVQGGACATSRVALGTRYGNARDDMKFEALKHK